MSSFQHNQVGAWNEDELDFVLQTGGAKSTEEVAALFNAYFQHAAHMTADGVKAIRERYPLQLYHPRRSQSATASQSTMFNARNAAGFFDNEVPNASLTAALIRAANQGILSDPDVSPDPNPAATRAYSPPAQSMEFGQPPRLTDFPHPGRPGEYPGLGFEWEAWFQACQDEEIRRAGSSHQYQADGRAAFDSTAADRQRGTIAGPSKNPTRMHQPAEDFEPEYQPQAYISRTEEGREDMPGNQVIPDIGVNAWPSQFAAEMAQEAVALWPHLNTEDSYL